MKIGIDARLWDETGVGRYIRNLIKNLGETDHSNEYILFVRTSDLGNIKSQISNLKYPNKWKIVEADVRWHSIEEQLRLPLILAKENCNLVHFPYFSVPILYPGKFVVTIHDLIVHHFDTGLATMLPLPLYKAKRLGYRLVMSQIARKAAKIITVSNTTKEEVVKLLKVDPEKVVVTHEGVDEKISNIKYQISNIKLKEPYFLYVGNAYPHKNLDRLIQAHNILVSQYPNIKLVFVGKEDYFYRRLKERVKNSDNIIFQDHVSDEELAQLYKEATALIMPSLMEGFGLPALEAMANNCLVLASDIAALRETCGEAAIYFNPYDVDDIRQKMEMVCSNDLEQWNKKKTIGLQQAKLFSWKKMAEETLRIYQEVGH